MKIDEKKDDLLWRLSVSERELVLIQGALREVVETIDDFEFYARVGGTKEEVNKLCLQ